MSYGNMWKCYCECELFSKDTQHQKYQNSTWQKTSGSQKADHDFKC